MSSRAEILKRLKKILDLAKHKTTDPGIAETAMRQAQKLMAQYSIEEHEVDDEAITTASATMRARWVKNVYRSLLAEKVARAFGVGWYYNNQAKMVDLRVTLMRGVMFVGPVVQVELSSYAYDTLLTQCERDRLKYLRRVRKAKNRASRGDAFCVGWVNSAVSALDKFQGKDSSKAITAYLDSIQNMTKSAPCQIRKGALTHNDRASGAEAGSKAQLHRPMTGRSGRLALPGATR
jgi:hypothetical protein